jgi:hypothetical protein
MMTEHTIKKQAKILQEFLKQNNTTITYSSCLQALAKMNGFKDWNTLSAQLILKQEVKDNLPSNSHVMDEVLPKDIENRKMPKAQLFLETWKKGVKLIGKKYFKDIGDVDDATRKWELVPNYELIKNCLFRISTRQAIFLSAMYCFYNREDGQEMLVQLGYPNFLDIFYILEKPYLEVIIQLIRSYEGW